MTQAELAAFHDLFLDEKAAEAAAQLEEKRHQPLSFGTNSTVLQHCAERLHSKGKNSVRDNPFDRDARIWQNVYMLDGDNNLPKSFHEVKQVSASSRHKRTCCYYFGCLIPFEREWMHQVLSSC